jgi:hypothetical protein
MVKLFTRVNGMNRSAGPAGEWPANEKIEVGA